MGMTCTPHEQERIDRQMVSQTALSATDPILINGNSDLQIFPGYGTEAHPFLIQHYNIQGSTFGISLQNTTEHVLIRNCYLNGGTEASIKIINSINVVIRNCVIINATSGISLDNSEDIKITVNNISLCNTGISISNTVNFTVEENRVYQHQIGVSATNTSNGIILGNTIFGNSQAGITLNTNTEHIQTFSNTFGWNGPQDTSGCGWNAVDGGTENLWDNNVSTGNMWNDYSGIGDYSIRGPSNSRDRFPTLLTDDKRPHIIRTEFFGNISIRYDQKPPILKWKAHDEFPNKYYVTINGVNAIEQYWDNGLISFAPENLRIGINIIVVQVQDCAGNTASSTVQVTLARIGLVDDPGIIIFSSFISVVGVALLIIGVKKLF